MSWELEAGEELRWEGRPAPRCWTFRNWRHACFGLLLLVFALWWQALGLGLRRESGQLWPALLPLPLVLTGAWLAVGHLLAARLEWPRVVYAVTDRGVLLQRALLRVRRQRVPLGELRYCALVPLGAQLAHVQLVDASGRRWQLCCIEQPQRLLPLLEAAIVANLAALPGERV